MASRCSLCGRPLSSTTWADLGAREQATGEPIDTPLDTDCGGDCWGCLREIETGEPDPRPPPGPIIDQRNGQPTPQQSKQE